MLTHIKTHTQPLQSEAPFCSETDIKSIIRSLMKASELQRGRFKPALLTHAAESHPNRSMKTNHKCACALEATPSAEPCLADRSG